MTHHKLILFFILWLGASLCCLRSGESFTACPRPRSNPKTQPRSAEHVLKVFRNHDSKENKKTLRARFSELRKKLFVTRKKVGLAVLTAVSVYTLNPNIASAAPTVTRAVKAGKPEVEAIEKAMQKKEDDLSRKYAQFQKEASQVYREQGQAAGEEFEKEYKGKMEHEKKELEEKLETLQRSLLDQGICPFADPEGVRQTVLLEWGVDLAGVTGTRQNLDRIAKGKEQRITKPKYTYQRTIVKLMVEDFKNRDIDPLPYFDVNTQKTKKILSMPIEKARKKIIAYRMSMEKYGQITPPKRGEQSVLEKRKQDPEWQKKQEEKEAEAKKAADPGIKAREEESEAEEKKEKAKHNAKAKKEALVKEKAAKKEAAKREKQAAKEAAKREGKAAKEAKKREELARSAEASVSHSTLAVEEDVGSLDESSSQEMSELDEEVDSIDDGFTVQKSPEDDGPAISTKERKLPIVPVSALLIATGGGGYAFKAMREKSAEREAERQRQFKLIMGITDDNEAASSPPAQNAKSTTAPGISLEKTPSQDSNGNDEPQESQPSKLKEKEPADSPPSADQPTEAPPTRKRRGIKAMFSKKSDRETDLGVLVGPDAKTPELAALIAKVLTFGAPGRFPKVVNLPGGMPMDGFDLAKAVDMLESAKKSMSVTPEEYAELFATVMNCMLIDIVDLASSSLKEDDEVTFGAINIVVDFMNHASILFDETAENVEITPVKYSGDLSKSKLEQMFSAYASSGTLQMEENIDSRSGLLSFVFGISDKKAEGLVMKATTRNMMKMLKTKDGKAKMEDMMKNMMGGEGMEQMMAGLTGEDEGKMPSMEEMIPMLTQLKTMKDQGQLDPAELKVVRSQFEESFGANIDQLVAQANADKDALSADETKLLDLMQSILKD